MYHWSEAIRSTRLTMAGGVKTLRLRLRLVPLERQHDGIEPGLEPLELGHQRRIGIRGIDQGLSQMIEPLLHLTGELGGTEDGPP